MYHVNVVMIYLVPFLVRNIFCVLLCWHVWQYARLVALHYYFVRLGCVVVRESLLVKIHELLDTVPCCVGD